MRLKVLTTTLVVFGLLLLLAWPIAVGPRPAPNAPRRLKTEWGQRVLVYFGVTSGTWLATAASALLLARQARRQYLNQESHNLKSLIEGTLRDHGKQP